MNLLLQRRRSGPHSTIGQLFELLPNGGAHGLCFTCEDVARPVGVKILGATAIPAGVYQVVITMSARFGRPLPLLVDVPGFSGIRIHPGNTDQDTEGCVLLGMSTDGESVGRSREACDKIQPRIEAAIAAGERVTIEVRNAAAVASV
jgi:hypothetical protein